MTSAFRAIATAFNLSHEYYNELKILKGEPVLMRPTGFHIIEIRYKIVIVYIKLKSKIYVTLLATLTLHRIPIIHLQFWQTNFETVCHLYIKYSHQVTKMCR